LWCGGEEAMNEEQVSSVLPIPTPPPPPSVSGVETGVETRQVPPQQEQEEDKKKMMMTMMEGMVARVVRLVRSVEFPEVGKALIFLVALLAIASRLDIAWTELYQGAGKGGRGTTGGHDGSDNAAGGGQYGIVVVIDNIRPLAPHPGAPVSPRKASVALLYCHQISNEQALAWLTQKRAELRETQILTDANREWRTPRCILPGAYSSGLDSYHRVDLTFGRYMDRDPLPARLSADQVAAIAQLRPRVAHAFIDTRAQLFYRVVSWERGSFRPVLLAHSDLMAALEGLSNQVNERFDSPREYRRMCVCPEHFGIVGSGLFFTPDIEDCEHTMPGEARWRVLAGVAVGAKDREARHTNTGHVSFTKHVARFPAEVDLRILWNETQRRLYYPDSIWFRASDVATTLVEAGTAVIERYDPAMRYMWRREAIAADATVTPTSGETVHVGPDYASVVDLVKTRTASGGTCRFREAPPSQALKCFYHCVRLDETLRGLGPKTDDHHS
jgi:hypothetical protein